MVTGGRPGGFSDVMLGHDGLAVIESFQTVQTVPNTDRQKAFCSACKLGDLDSVRHMLEEGDVNVNLRDEWDAFPLYYACYGGHLDVVRLLINYGARCHPGTFDGESVLKNPQFAAVSVDSVWLAPDATVVNAHKLILACRSSFFRRQLSKPYCIFRCLLNVPVRPPAPPGSFSDPRTRVACRLRGQGKVMAEADYDEEAGSSQCFRSLPRAEREELERGKSERNSAGTGAVETSASVANLIAAYPCLLTEIIRYLYTDEMEVPLEDVSCFLTLANAFKLKDLRKRIEEEKVRIDTHMHHQSSRKLLAAPHTLGLSPRKDFPSLLASDMRRGVARIFRHAERQWKACCRGGKSEKEEPRLEAPLGRGTVEVPEEAEVDVWSFALVLEYMYTDAIFQVPSFLVQPAKNRQSESLLRLIECGSMFLMPGLVSVCSAALSPLVDASNVCAVYRVADLLRLDRLVFRCASVMAEKIDSLLPRLEFHQLVLASAHSLKNREAVDSIPVVEELVDALAQMYGGSENLCGSEDTPAATEWLAPAGVLPFTGEDDYNDISIDSAHCCCQGCAENVPFCQSGCFCHSGDSEARGSEETIFNSTERGRRERGSVFLRRIRRLSTDASLPRQFLAAPDVLLLRGLYQEKVEKIDQLLESLQLNT
uniref:Ankyrin repeat-containing protein n=1 Tax=Toxoplasma gondii (strain ATCC 50861 / VEG) TaxID=432359 RepID=A0A0F7V5X7_TOXGV|nr:TPA: ankyrin repeat-containing protein [Toxoplasma gondii VEG]